MQHAAPCKAGTSRPDKQLQSTNPAALSASNSPAQQPAFFPSPRQKERYSAPAVKPNSKAQKGAGKGEDSPLGDPIPSPARAIFRTCKAMRRRWALGAALHPAARRRSPLPLQFSAAGTAFPQALLVDFQAAPSAPTRNQEEARAAPHFPGQAAAPPGQKKSPASMGRVLLKGKFFRRLLRRLPGRVGEIPVDALSLIHI